MIDGSDLAPDWPPMAGDVASGRLRVGTGGVPGRGVVPEGDGPCARAEAARAQASAVAGILVFMDGPSSVNDSPSWSEQVR
jgi:hypothetical protein